MRKMWFRSKSYLRYLLRRKNKYAIHSPFVFEFINAILSDNTRYAAYDVMRINRKEMFSRSEVIETTDFGANAGSNEGVTYAICAGSLARQRSNRVWVYELLYRLVHHYKPVTIVEMGTSVGFSSMALALGNPMGKVVTLEGCSKVAAIARHCFAKLAIENIEVVTGNFDQTLPQILEENKRVDLVFFDGNHRKEPTLAYFSSCLEKAHEHSIFIFDDIHWSPGMEEAWQELIHHQSVTVSIDLYQLGLIFFRKGISKQHFTLKV
jgi:predicted O-methyltransferase YrrM